MLNRRRLIARLGFAAGLAALSPLHAGAHPQPVTVFAAASLKTALDKVATMHMQASGTRIVITYAASSALARQIEKGAPADVFISADIPWMDHLDKAGLLETGTRTDLLGNTLVIVAPADAAVPLPLTPEAIDRTLGTGRLAVGLVASVPAGRYAKAALVHLGLWSTVEGRLAQAENVRAALAFVARGEAPLGIVYATDAVADRRVRVVARIPSSAHPPIVYPLAVMRERTTSDLSPFLRTLRSAASSQIFRDEGFDMLTERPGP